MHSKQSGQQQRSLLREPLRGKNKEAASKEYETLCLNQSEMKHMHAIRPYCSRDQQRKNTRREGKQNQSPYEMTRSNSKRLDSSSRKSEERPKKNDALPSLPAGNRQMSDMLGELINLKSEYKVLKGNYTKILGEKKEEVLREQRARKELEEELDRRGREAERWQKSAGLLEQEIDRIRKECSRVLELERFKMKKLEETLQEKELMIAYLRNEVDCLKRSHEPAGNPSQPLFFLQNSAPMLNFSYYKPSNISVLSSIPAADPRPSFPEQDSLSLSRDKSKEADSIIHSFLSNDHSIHRPAVGRREGGMPMHSLQESPIEPDIEPISEKSEPSQMDFKKGKEPREFVDLAVESNARVRQNPKKLQILIADENLDTQNIPGQNLREQLSMQTKKKTTNSSLLMCKQKKKLTAKKIKPF